MDIIELQEKLNLSPDQLSQLVAKLGLEARDYYEGDELDRILKAATQSNPSAAPEQPVQVSQPEQNGADEFTLARSMVAARNQSLAAQSVVLRQFEQTAAVERQSMSDLAEQGILYVNENRILGFAEGVRRGLGKSQVEALDTTVYMQKTYFKRASADEIKAALPPLEPTAALAASEKSA